MLRRSAMTLGPTGTGKSKLIHTTTCTRIGDGVGNWSQKRAARSHRGALLHVSLAMSDYLPAETLRAPCLVGAPALSSEDASLPSASRAFTTSDRRSGSPPLMFSSLATARARASNSHA